MASKKSKKNEEAEVFKNDDELIDSLLVDLTSEFGEGTMLLDGDGAGAEVTAWIPSGSPALDFYLGGGWAGGRVVEIFGPESNGKCLTADTKVLTPVGYKSIADVFKEKGLEPNLGMKTVEVTYPLVNRYGKVENTTHFTINGKRKVKKLVTRTGSEIKGTYRHPLLVVNNYGVMVWKHIEDIVEGDFLVLRRGDNISSEESNDSITEEQAIVLGALVADGYFGKHEVTFTKNNAELMKIVRDVAPTLVGLDKTKENFNANTENERASYVRFSGKQATESFYNEYGFVRGVAKDKCVPKQVKFGSVAIQKAFIKGYLDCESNISNGQLSVTSASKELLKDIKLMLQNIGVISFLSLSTKPSTKEKYPDKDYWHLSISGADLQRYENTIGFYSEYRKQQYNTNKPEAKGTNHDSIPNIGSLAYSFYNSVSSKTRKRDVNGVSLRSDSFERNKELGVTRKRLEALLQLDGDKHLKELLAVYLDENFYFDKVTIVEELGELPTFDFAMEETHSFIAEGIVSHNTTVALHAIAETQKMGGIGIFLDTEHALDKRRAKSIGVDLKRLIYAQPETMEKLFEYVERTVELIAKKSPDKLITIVWDSVAATPTETEVEGEYGDAVMGIHARIMSQAFRKITAKISKYKVLFICINQIRDKIGGVSWGEKSNTFGGRALKFYATQRVDVRKVGNYKEGEVIKGIKCEATIKKNKVAPPFGVAKFNILFRDEYGGIDPYTSLLEDGFEKGMFGSSKGWYDIDGKKYRVADAVELLENDAELWKKLVDTYMSMS